MTPFVDREHVPQVTPLPIVSLARGEEDEEDGGMGRRTGRQGFPAPSNDRQGRLELQGIHT